VALGEVGDNELSSQLWSNWVRAGLGQGMEFLWSAGRFIIIFFKITNGRI
jgi:hypothetical protein